MVKTYNTAALAHSGLAKIYNDKVTARRAQNESGEKSFDNFGADIPFVPCQPTQTPTWVGKTFPASTLTMATLNKANNMFYTFTDPASAVTNEIKFANGSYDLRSGWM